MRSAVWNAIRRRWLSSLSYTYSKEGLSAQQAVVPAELGASEVQVSFLACGVSPYDKVKEGSVFGTSGVAVIDKIGSSVKGLRKGDHVVPIKPGLGTWREVGVLSVADLTTVPASLKVEQAATLWSGALAALRIFEDFNPTGSIVINGAETAVGQALVQMAAYRGLSTVCIVADDLPDIAPVVEGLKYLGGTVVVTESYPINQLKELVSDISKPALGVNICGGPSVKTLSTLVGSESKMVTLKDSAKGVEVGKSFSLAEWSMKASRKHAEAMVKAVVDMHTSGKLITLAKRVRLESLPSEAEGVGMPLRTLVGIVGK